MRYAWLVVLAVGCYEAPDYSGTQFKCDADHPCPRGQTCVSGRCGGGPASAPDAAMPAMAVACGAATCGAGEKCCSNLFSPPSCIPLGATCAGIAATCDGVEDCAGGTCCDGSGGSQQIACTPTCAGTTICRDNADCIGGATTCCLSIGGTNEPWGRCLSVCP